MKTLESALKIHIATPCQARWDEMKGDERARFCLHCSKHVYNLSAMSAPAAAELVREKEGNLCVRFYRRADGTVLHGKDCPVGMARYRQRMRAFWSAGVSAIVLMFAHARAFAGSDNQVAIPDAAKNLSVQIVPGLDPGRPTMGDMMPAPPPPAPSPIPLPPVPSPTPNPPGHPD